jgi:transcriptional regulator with XRE-family HTH domain
MKTPTERGRIGRWLVESRRARGITTAEKARAHVERETGTRIGLSVYREYEAGTRTPSDGHMPALIQAWGAPPTLESLTSADLEYLRRIAEALERAYPPPPDEPEEITVARLIEPPSEPPQGAD